MTRRTIAALAVLATLATCAGCSGSDSSADAHPGARDRGMSLKETCPQVEAAVRGVDIISSPDRLQTAHDKVQALAEAGDLETRNALRPVVSTIAKMHDAQPGQQAADAFDAWTTTLGDISKRCGAVGSSAFQ